MTHIYIYMPPDEDGYPPYDTEEIDAEARTNNLFVLEGVPAFAGGLARGDLVEVVKWRGDDDRLWVHKVVEASGHWTARIIPFDEDQTTAHLPGLSLLGCNVVRTPFGRYAIDIPPGVSVDGVMLALSKGRTDGTWDYEVGIGPIGGEDLSSYP